MSWLGIDFNDFNYTFNLENFGLGMLAGWATAYGYSRTRRAMRSARSTVAQRTAVQQFAGRGPDSRYLADLMKVCEAAHLAGENIPLSKVLVEPRFIRAAELVQPADDDILQTVFHVVPLVHDHPYLHAPYNIATLAIPELDNGDRALALLGLPGSGRTTALMAIALWCLGKVTFPQPVDKVQESIEAAEAAIEGEDERNARISQRKQSFQQALHSLATRKGVDPETLEGTGMIGGGTLFRQLTPMYAHFGNILLSRREFGRTIDPAEPLFRAVQYHTTGLSARTLAPKFYQRLAQGKVLLLLDGFDEMPESEHPRLLNWLESYLEQYGNNFAIVTGPARGYGGMVEAGLAPVFLRPWNDVNTKLLADVWAEHWQEISGKRRRDSALDERTLAYAKSSNRGYTPFDLALKFWTTYDILDSSDYETRMNTFWSRHLPEKERDALLPDVIEAARLQLETGFITVGRLVETAMEAVYAEFGVSASQAASVLEDEADEDEAAFEESTRAETARVESITDDLDDIDMDDDEALDERVPDEDDLNDSDAEPAAAVDTITAAPSLDDKEVAKQLKKRHAELKKHYQKLVERLHKDGLLTQYRHKRYQFMHPLAAAYFASLMFKDMPEEKRETVLLEKAFVPAWQNALAYTTLHTPVDTVVQARIDASQDILYTPLLDTARWLAYASGKVAWRGNLLRTLGNMLVAQSQYASVRERIAAALISTRDKNALVIFKRSLTHPNPHVRQLACLGIGALQAEGELESLTERLLDDNENVMLSAGLALGAIGTEDALVEMEVALTEGSETLRKAVAEAFAAIPEEGYPILYNAVHDDDYLLRRAALFGLRRINTPWSLVALYRRSIEDQEWYVRSAAETVFQEMQYGDSAAGVRHYPPVESIPWIQTWLEELSEEEREMAAEDATQFLRKALVEGTPEMQRLAAANMGQMGIVDYTGLLYMTLRHQDGGVREEAYRALGNLQQHIGQSLPSPF